MYNQGAPPFRPPGSFPPFAPGRPPSSGMPPFAPPNGIGRPPFSPNFPPGMSPDGLAGSSTPLPFRPPATDFGAAPRPSHAGLGLPPRPGHPSMPSPASGSSMPSFVREVKTTSVFIGAIAPGITNQVLQDLLNACGPLHELKRVTGAGGKPAAIGFALFESPEVVMRCVRCLNGVELPDLTPEGRSAGKPPKPLVVKVDEKTQSFLDEFERTVGRSDDEESADAVSRRAISHIVALLSDPNAAPPVEQNDDRPMRPPPGSVLPVHLQDLQEGDLPEEQRGQVLSQINAFREQSAKRERQKKLEEEGRERYRALQANNQGPSQQTYGRPPPGTSDRGAYQQQQRPPQGAPDHHQRQNSMPLTNGQTLNPAPQRSDPQSYNQPVAFVRAQNAESKEQTERTDEEEEQIRRQRQRRDHDNALRDRERQVEGREGFRIANAQKEMAYRKKQSDLKEREQRHIAADLAHWDDEEKIERGKELFYADRGRWRAHRQSARKREYQDDVRDRQIEEDERKALEQESEDFLTKHMAEFSELDGQVAPVAKPVEGLAPIKLAIAPILEPKEEKKPDIAAPRRAGITFEGDDDDEDKRQKKKRTLVKLEYEGEEIDEAEALVRRNARLLEIRKGVPVDVRDLRRTRVEWAVVNERLLREKLQPFIAQQITKYLGELDQDLVAFAIEQIRARKTIDDVIDGLEPVLAEETNAFASAIWRQLVFESDAFIQGIETGAMMAQA